MTTDLLMLASQLLTAEAPPLEFNAETVAAFPKAIAAPTASVSLPAQVRLPSPRFCDRAHPALRRQLSSYQPPRPIPSRPAGRFSARRPTAKTIDQPMAQPASQQSPDRAQFMLAQAGRLPSPAASTRSVTPVAQPPSIKRPMAKFSRPLSQPVSQLVSSAPPLAQSPEPAKPTTGGQLYQQRWVAVDTGEIFTQLPSDSFYNAWAGEQPQPTYEQWKQLLAAEAEAAADRPASERLTVVLGDSLSLWLPQELLPPDRLWLNQGISGDTTAGILSRLGTLAQTHPEAIHVMAGVNDLKTGATDREVLGNLQQIMRRLRQAHPDAKIVIHSILPTRYAQISRDRVRILNGHIAEIAQTEGVSFLDLQSNFADEQGYLRFELTTDGVHLSQLGYHLWQLALTAV
ncbi:G-D-S-L family lipolytic protein [Romeria aff. gracilis LEGE 07310]|uniref:G-D-S-L family lipolytic protein n=1 Tax=Vasconcelosia minhoensis LEGE 07310 TaxID=915328 RepID=A0A8J7APM7_9CYAN|nr:GDSL-type esterase/lipase family protein [Romeria gracilis]MBE9077926.1 G-D-S-L family lipolytic protein [Romeria aff. gracilis LEGE 07310]